MCCLAVGMPRMTRPAPRVPSRLQDDEISTTSAFQGLDEELGVALPPMPSPDLRSMRSEAAAGISLVLCLICTFVGITVSEIGRAHV